MQWVMFPLCVLGLLLPGYMICRALRVGPAWAAAFPISALLISLFVILAECVSLRLEFEVVGAGLLLVSAICRIILWHRGERVVDVLALRDNLKLSRLAAMIEQERTVATVGGDSWLDRSLSRCALLLASVAIAIVFWRCAVVPLSYSDTLFRWEWLARLMLQEQSLSAYPPRFASDFNRYFYPDGIAPLVSCVYWWLYAGWGGRWPALSAISVSLQLLSAMGLAAHAARRMFGPGAQWYALLAMVASSALLTAFAVSLETGFTAIAVAGQLCFIAGATERNINDNSASRWSRARWVIAAALFAAIGAMSRDYGPALAVTGLCAILQRRDTRWLAPLFVVVFTALAMPWYLRNFLLTGNPVFPLAVGSLFPVNPVLQGVLTDYQKQFGLFASGVGVRLREFGDYLAAGAGVLMLAGLPLVVWQARRHTSLLVTFVLMCLLWAWSSGVASSGFVMNGRVLAPAWIALSIAIGAACSAQSPRWRTLRNGWLIVATLTAIVSLISLSAYPLSISNLRAGWRLSVPEPMYWNGPAMRVVDTLNAEQLKPTALLTDDVFLAVVLDQRSAHRPVSIWNPRVAFVFDPSLSAGEVRKMLIDSGITLVSITPGSANNRFLAKQRFYAEDSPHWRRISRSDQPVRIYEIPHPPPARP
jgi:hypothetical protein